MDASYGELAHLIQQAASLRRGKVTVDHAVAVIGRFRNSALATLEATRFGPGRKKRANDRN